VPSAVTATRPVVSASRSDAASPSDVASPCDAAAPSDPSWPSLTSSAEGPAGVTTFAAAVGCIDGRAHPALTRFVAAEHDVDAVDLVTEPGVDGALAAGDRQVLDDVLRRLGPSREAHACRTVVVAGHEDCAAVPGDLEVHRAAVACAARRLADELDGVPVQAVVVHLDGTVERVSTAATCR
jgi:hypothetical protein